jgi:hypothetical protein
VQLTPEPQCLFRQCHAQVYRHSNWSSTQSKPVKQSTQQRLLQKNLTEQTAKTTSLIIVKAGTVYAAAASPLNCQPPLKQQTAL